MKKHSMAIGKNYIYILIIITALSSCSNNKLIVGNNIVLHNQLQQTYQPQLANNYLAQAEESDDIEIKNNSLISSLDLMSNQANIKQAQEIYKEINKKQLNETQKIALKLISAKIKLVQKNNKEAKQILETIPTEEIPKQWQTVKNNLLVTTYNRLHELEFSLKTQATNKQIVSSETISSLRNYSSASLEKNMPYQIAARLAELEIINRKQHTSDDEVANDITRWLQRPEAKTIKDLVTINPVTKKHKTIAILLPLNGDFAKTSNNILNGFLAAYYAARSNDKIIIKDTSLSSFNEVLQTEIINNKIDLVIGPLEKNQTIRLTTENAPYIINLNKNSNIEGDSNKVITFSIASSEEVEQVVTDNINKGYFHSLVITTPAAIQQKISTKFSEKWQQMGGETTTLVLDKSSEFSSKIKSLFAIDKSESRAAEIEKIIDEKVKFTPVRRKDINMIFLAIPPQSARQIKPLLEYYFAGDIPVIATSNIYNTSSDTYQDQDLDKIIFCDSEWIVNNKSNTIASNTLKRLWPEDFYNQKRLYGMGIDVFNLSKNLYKLQTLKTSYLIGASGILALENNNITRKLIWAQFKNGKAKYLPNY